MSECVCVCVSVCVRERERERDAREVVTPEKTQHWANLTGRLVFRNWRRISAEPAQERGLSPPV